MKLHLLVYTALFCGSIAFAQEATSPATPAPKKGAPTEERFRKFDKDKDNALSLEEFSKGGKDAAKSEAGFKKRDKDGDGKMTLEEYLSK